METFSFLSLFVFRVGADYAHHTLAVNHLALVANLFDGRTDFHYWFLDYLYR